MKTLTPPEIKKACKGKTTAFIAGNFNIVHPGHQRLINFAADCADILIVALFPDGADDIYIHQDLRLEGVSSISKVNYAFIMENSLLETIDALKPNFVVKGKEHEFKKNLEANVVLSYGGKILFSSGESFLSSGDLLRSELGASASLGWSSESSRSYLDRHKITLNKLKDFIKRMSTLNVVVVGDLIIDEYIACEPMGMSREDPVIVVSPIETKRYVGGAGIVSGHINGLGANVCYATVVGDDASKNFADNFFKENNISTVLIVDPSRPTTLKQKFRAAGKSLLRVNHLKSHEISADLGEKLFSDMEEYLAGADLVIFSDFNYGCLPTKLVEKISEYCHKNNIKMAADSQSSSQVGDISRFQKMLLITPTEHEARLACRDFSSGLVSLVDRLKKSSEAEHVLVTLGGDGVLVHDPDNCQNEIFTDQLPALNPNPRDVAGAGDSLLSCAAMAMVLGANIFEAAYLGSVAAAIQVGRIGNVPLSPQELMENLHQ